MKLSNVVIFAIGAALGSLATWKFVKTKYERIANEEIESVKETFSKKQKKEYAKNYLNCDDTIDITDLGGKLTDKMESEDKHEKEYEEMKKQYDKCKNIIDERGYLFVERQDGTIPKPPYVISPEEFDTLDDYGTETLTYYADGVLTDDFDNPIEDVEAMVGVESLTHFGEYEDDSVFVRNERHRIDYEILADERNFSEVVDNT